MMKLPTMDKISQREMDRSGRGLHPAVDGQGINERYYNILNIKSMWHIREYWSGHKETDTFTNVGNLT